VAIVTGGAHGTERVNPLSDLRMKANGVEETVEAVAAPAEAEDS